MKENINHHQQNRSCTGSKRCLLTVENGHHEFADLMVYPLQTLDRLQVQVRRVCRLADCGVAYVALKSNGEYDSPRRQVGTAPSQDLICKIAEYYFQKDNQPLSFPALLNKCTQVDSNHYWGEYPVTFFQLVSVVGSIGLPLQGEISPYRHIALFVPLLDALFEKTVITTVELLQLLILTEATRRFQEIEPVAKGEIINELKQFIDGMLSKFER